jgi:hypothetical protein
MDLLQSQVTIAEQIIAGILISALFALVWEGALIAIDYARTKASLIKDEKSRKLFTNALDDAERLIKTNIASAETTLKPKILAAIADGKVDKSELSSLATVVNENVLKQLGTQSVDVLNKNLGDTNSYLQNWSEDILAKLKNDPSSIVSKTIIPDVSTTAEVVKEQSVLEEVKSDDSVVADNSTIVSTVENIVADDEVVAEYKNS